MVPATGVEVSTPKIGDVVTFSYESFSRRDTPVNPIIYRTRSDVLWDDVVSVSERERSAISEGKRSKTMREEREMRNREKEEIIM